MFPKKSIDRCRASVLLVSPADEDFRSLRRILNDTRPLNASGAEWSVLRYSTAKAAATELKKSRIPILVCECDLAPNAWRVLLKKFVHLPDPPLLIVTSRLADDRLWAEALNLGAWDVLAKPLDTEEVRRALNTAWLHWCTRSERAVR
jgi:DNA-binding response OmpR family regulator